MWHKSGAFSLTTETEHDDYENSISLVFLISNGQTAADSHLPAFQRRFYTLFHRISLKWAVAPVRDRVEQKLLEWRTNWFEKWHSFFVRHSNPSSSAVFRSSWNAVIYILCLFCSKAALTPASKHKEHMFNFNKIAGSVNIVLCHRRSPALFSLEKYFALYLIQIWPIYSNITMIIAAKITDRKTEKLESFPFLCMQAARKPFILSFFMAYVLLVNGFESNGSGQSDGEWEREYDQINRSIRKSHLPPPIVVFSCLIFPVRRVWR